MNHEGTAERTQLPDMAEEILEYFLRHPDMTETVSGVLRWRLLEESIRRRLDGGQAAFDFLVEQGFLQPVPLPSAKEAMYSLNPQRRVEGERFLEELRQRREELAGSKAKEPRPEPEDCIEDS